MSEFRECVIARMVSYYIKNDKRRKQYIGEICDALNELDMNIKSDETNTQEYLDLMSKTGKLLLEDSQFGISGTLSMGDTFISVLTVFISILSAVIVTSYTDSRVALAIIICMIAFVTIYTFCRLRIKAKEGDAIIKKLIAVYIKQYGLSVENKGSCKKRINVLKDELRFMRAGKNQRGEIKSVLSKMWESIK